MKILCNPIFDTIYPKSDTSFKRQTVRAILLNEKNEVALIHIKGEDMFGHRDHYELPGGGIDLNETHEQTFLREVAEELGFEGKVETYIGTIEIEYNLLHRTDVSNFYLGYITGKVDMNREEYEKKLFNDIIFISLDKIEEFYQKRTVRLVGSMIHKRDLCALKAAKMYLLNKNG